jgi:hypothetical protein
VIPKFKKKMGCGASNALNEQAGDASNEPPVAMIATTRTLGEVTADLTYFASLGFTEADTDNVSLLRVLGEREYLLSLLSQDEKEQHLRGSPLPARVAVSVTNYSDVLTAPRKDRVRFHTQLAAWTPEVASVYKPMTRILIYGGARLGLVIDTGDQDDLYQLCLSHEDTIYAFIVNLEVILECYDDCFKRVPEVMHEHFDGRVLVEIANLVDAAGLARHGPAGLAIGPAFVRETLKGHMIPNQYGRIMMHQIFLLSKLYFGRPHQFVPLLHGAR